MCRGSFKFHSSIYFPIPELLCASGMSFLRINHAFSKYVLILVSSNRGQEYFFVIFLIFSEI